MSGGLEVKVKGEVVQLGWCVEKRKGVGVIGSVFSNRIDELPLIWGTRFKRP